MPKKQEELCILCIATNLQIDRDLSSMIVTINLEAIKPKKGLGGTNAKAS
jgi:hypothetical protein